jgi:multidrug transporter EmrE-like cation transporter
MKYGKISVYSTFMMLVGMILPYLYGIIFLFESISAARIGGLVILILALLCSVVNFTEKKENTLSKIYYILCVFIFLLNGAMSIISKTHSINISAVPAANFIVYSNLWLTIINGAVYFIFARCMKSSEKQKNAQEIKSNKPNKFYAILAVTAFAVISGLGFLFQLISAKNVPAVTLYPFVTGGTIILSATCARIFFKEKISPPALAGIIMSFCGTLLFLIN